MTKTNNQAAPLSQESKQALIERLIEQIDRQVEADPIEQIRELNIKRALRPPLYRRS